MTVKAKDLVQVAPLYYEFIGTTKNGRKSRKFWEVVPSSWDQHGNIRSFATAWGRIGSSGSSKDRPGKSAYELNRLIESKTDKGYRRVTRPEYRVLVPIDGLKPGNVGIVLNTKRGWRSWTRVAEILLGGVVVCFPVRFLTVIKAATPED